MNELNEIFDRHGSDKGSGRHNYGPVYTQNFESFRQRPLNLLEIGVLSGASLRAWREYFPAARIWGLDIDPAVAVHVACDDRIRLVIGSQNDETVLAGLVRDSGGFDIVIDDGSHMVGHIIASLKHLFPCLHPGGLYVVEDLRESYRAGVAELARWDGNHLNTHIRANDRAPLDQLLHDWIRYMDYGEGEVESVHFHRELLVIRKRAAELRDTI